MEFWIIGNKNLANDFAAPHKRMEDNDFKFIECIM